MQKVKSISLILTLAGACLLGAAQAHSASQVDIRGAITHLHSAQGESGKSLGSVLIEGVKESDTQFDKASVQVTTETKLFIKQGKERRATEFAALKEGQKVEASFSGPVMESYPPQATAAEITILEE